MIRVTIRLPVVSVLAIIIIIVYGEEQFSDDVLGAAAFIYKEL